MNNKIKLSRNKLNLIHSIEVVKAITVLVLITITFFNSNLNAAANCKSSDGEVTVVVTGPTDVAINHAVNYSRTATVTFNVYTTHWTGSVGCTDLSGIPSSSETVKFNQLGAQWIQADLRSTAGASGGCKAMLNVTVHEEYEVKETSSLTEYGSTNYLGSESIYNGTGDKHPYTHTKTINYTQTRGLSVGGSIGIEKIGTKIDANYKIAKSETITDVISKTTAIPDGKTMYFYCRSTINVKKGWCKKWGAGLVAEGTYENRILPSYDKKATIIKGDPWPTNNN